MVGLFHMKTLTVGVFNKEILSYSTPFCGNNFPLICDIYMWKLHGYLIYHWDLLWLTWSPPAGAVLPCCPFCPSAQLPVIPLIPLATWSSAGCTPPHQSAEVVCVNNILIFASKNFLFVLGLKSFLFVLNLRCYFFPLWELVTVYKPAAFLSLAICDGK